MGPESPQPPDGVLDHDPPPAERPVVPPVLGRPLLPAGLPPGGCPQPSRVEVGDADVRQVPDPADARSFRVHLTEKGRGLEGPVLRCWERAEERTFAGLGPTERSELGRLLAKVRAGLGANRN